MIRIRQALQSDLGWLLLQLREFDQFFGGTRSLFPTDETVALRILDSIIETQVVLIAEKVRESIFERVVLDPERMGFIAGALGPHPYNPELTVLSEQFWWVAPQHRGSSAGARLFAEFLEFGKAHADWIVMTLESKSPIDPTSLERKGFRLHERSYLLEVGASAERRIA